MPVEMKLPALFKETTCKKYNDHRHWRTDKALFILNPAYEISQPPREGAAKEEPTKQGK